MRTTLGPTTSILVPIAASDPRLTEAALCSWLGAAAPGDQLAYHRGFLALDATPAAQRLPERERVELLRVARRARWAAEAGLVDMVQRRNGRDNYTYLLIARPRPEMARGSILAILVESDE